MTTRIVVLAAGKGTRMKSDVPKVLQDLDGRPIISHLADTILATGIDPHPVAVVSEDGAAVREALGGKFVYAVQKEQLGTGHAVRCAEEILRNKADAVIVLYGDHPFVKAGTINRLKELHEKGGCPITMMTAKVPDFEDWRAPFYEWGRVVRDSGGRIGEIVEKKDATTEQLDIKEVNPSFFCFRAEWLWERLRGITNENAQGEYYLVDLVRRAIREGSCVTSAEADPREALGVNTPEDLDLARQLISSIT